MQTIIRPVIPADAQALCIVCGKDLGYPCEAEALRGRILELDPRREAVFVAEREGQAVGFLHVELYKCLYARTMGNILGLAVSGEHRKQGIGGMLLQAAEDWARENGAAAMRLNSGGTRLEAHAFYRHHGYNSEKAQLRFLKNLT